MGIGQLINQNWSVIALAAFALGILLELGAIRFLKRKGEVPLKDSLLSIFLGLASDPINAIFAFITAAALFAAAPLPLAIYPSLGDLFYSALYSTICGSTCTIAYATASVGGGQCM